MKILVRRLHKTETTSIGEMSIDGKFECYTLEDVERAPGVKVFGQTAIPKGTYKVVVTPSNHFKRDLPLLVSVPNYEGVRIHPGNYAKDTEGCILVGRTKTVDMIGESKLAFEPLFEKIKAAIASDQEVTITIE